MLLDADPVASLDDYRARGGLAGLSAAERKGPDWVIEELGRSGLRGRGGAGFPAAIKWRSILSGGAAAGQRFVVANGAEGEPGTYKDRSIIDHDPYSLIEGVILAARTLGAKQAFIALKSSFTREAERTTSAATEFADAGIAGDVQIELVLGPDEYLFGEEKALLEVIEGEEPLPRLFPPYLYGLFTTSPQVGWSAGSTRPTSQPAGSNPTLVNNVETLARVPMILGRGAEWYRSVGTDESPGPVICTVSGDTIRHGVGEFDMGTPLSTVIATLGGGMPAGRAVKYVLSGISNPVIRADHLDTPVSYEAMEAIGSGLGTAGFIVFDDRTDPAELAAAVSRFLSVESCGQCSPCKLGTARITEILDTAVGTLETSATGELSARLANVTDSSRCFLPTQEQRLVTSLLPDIRTPELRQPPRHMNISKILRLTADRFDLDESQARKQPDWTYRGQ
jgi:NADH:ubiquinone oxidoreductase subunit F (NADH-binding)